MSTRNEYFFKRFSRAVSEFLILAIIAEQGEIYPYEIQQRLLKDVFHEQQVQSNVSHQLIVIGETILKYSRDPSPENRKSVMTLQNNLDSPFLQLICQQLFKVSTQDNQSLQSLAKLLDDATQPRQSNEMKLRIWNSMTAIYQVINNLKKQELIDDARTEVHSGHTRKYYRITEKGRLQALGMWLIMGDLYQLVASKIKVFHGTFPILFQNHQRDVLDLVDMVFPDKPLKEVMKDLGEKYPFFQRFIEDLFPSVGNDYLLMALLLEDTILEKDFNIYNLSLNQEEIFKHTLLERLKEYRKRIDENINRLQSS